jgi:carboxyl-terminal processing protease
VLVDHWTGSMGEGMAIGLDGMGRATVAGTRMAGLNGAVFDLELPNTRIRLNYAAERLAHLDGTPREYYVPSLHVDLLDPAHAGVDDPVFQAGIALLQQRVHSEESAPGSLHSFPRHPSRTRGNNA